jgi:X-Pro dipeptidyl-peptidase
MKKCILINLWMTALFLLAGIDLSAQENNLKSEASTPSVKTVVPVIIDGEAQKIADFEKQEDWIKQDLWVETTFDSDGDGKPDRMHVDVARPKQTDTERLKLPVIYESSPYFAGTGSTKKEYFWDVKQELNSVQQRHPSQPLVERRGKRPVISTAQYKWIPYGFIVVHSSAPGTGLSQGCPTIGGDPERLAPKAVIDWLNGRAKGFTTPDGNDEVKAYWTTGKVGMTGTSYDGTIPVAAATTGVEGLEAVIPIAPNTSYYHYYRSNGLVRSPGGYLGEDVDVLYEFIHSNPDRCAWCDSVIRDGEFAKGQDRITGDYSKFWEERDLLSYMKDYKAATLMAHGFNDWNVVPEHSYRIIKALKEKGIPVQIYYHQAGHGGEPPFKMMNRWFTKYLFGVENGVENDPKAWIVRENEDRQKPTPYKDYPNPDAMPVELYLVPGSPAAGKLTLEKEKLKAKEKLVDDYNISGSELAQAASSGNRLMYLTPVLKEPLHISGVPKITIRAASNKSAVNLSVWLVTLPWNPDKNARIYENIVNRGWADLQNSKSITKSKPLVPGKFYEMTFDLEPDDQVIPAGKQLGLMIFSSDKEFTLWPAPGTEMTVDAGKTRLYLPVVGGKNGLKF